MLYLLSEMVYVQEVAQQDKQDLPAVSRKKYRLNRGRMIRKKRKGCKSLNVTCAMLYWA